tara:strand:+ start:180 stop:602 length:423 start_codon:yes stop_codon:yes gene_type:complete
MIKYNLKCKNKHEFESWFSDSKEFEKLKNSKIIECIYCKTKSIEKSIMSPRISNKDVDEKNVTTDKDIKKVKNELLKIQKFVEKNFKYVGDKFPKEVRNIYYDKKGEKNIYGNATQKETEELKEEGIEVATIPWVKKKDN